MSRTRTSGAWIFDVGIDRINDCIGVELLCLARKAAVTDERVEPRDMLDLTVAFDHDVVDGAPAARFVKRLVELIYSGHGLEEARTNGPRLSAAD